MCQGPRADTGLVPPRGARCHWGLCELRGRRLGGHLPGNASQKNIKFKKNKGEGGLKGLSCTLSFERAGSLLLGHGEEKEKKKGPGARKAHGAQAWGSPGGLSPWSPLVLPQPLTPQQVAFQTEPMWSSNVPRHLGCKSGCVR